MKKSHLVNSAIILVLVIGVYFGFFRNSKAPAELITVTKGSITEVVSITGNTTPTQSVSLGFQNSGTIAYVYRNLGDKVSAGEVVAKLNMANLSASLQQAQANVAVQQAKLDGLKAGSRPADIASSQAALQKAQQDLANLYSSISDAATSGYAKANDAVRTQLSTFFSNAETNQPQLNFQTSNPQAASNAVSLRLSASIELNIWQQELAGISTLSSPDALITVLRNNLSRLTTIQNLLNASSVVLDGSINLSAAQLAANKASVTAGLTEVNSSMSSLNSISQSIAYQQATVAQAQAQLSLKQSGSTVQDIAAQQAQVDQAQAGVASAMANLQGAEIIAPISGVVTQQDAKIGQLASPGSPLVSIIGNKGFEMVAGVSETDIGKLTFGNKVTITLDAFPNEVFSGSVFYIAPAQTNNQGVITYQVKISFDQADPRLKSGLTANIKIETRRKDGALILPQYAILQNDKGTFVEVTENKKVKQIPVVIGIRDEKGNVEIMSGVTEGMKVLNIGLKS